jgi:hypothetical protein
MKKVSIVAAKQSRNISQQKLTIGLDLGDRNSWYCVVDEAGQIRLEQRVHYTCNRLVTSEMRILQQLTALARETSRNKSGVTLSARFV